MCVLAKCQSCDSAGGNNTAMQENTYLITCNLYMSSSFNKPMFLILGLYEHCSELRL